MSILPTRSSRSPVRMALTATLLFSAAPAWAVDATWNGTTNSDYNLGSNWSGGLVPSPAGTSLFNNAGNSNTTLTNTNTTINAIRFDTAAAAYTIGATPGDGVITLDSNFAGGVIQITATGVSDQRVNSDLILGNITGGTPGSSGTYAFSNLAAATGPILTVAGDISGYVGGTAGSEILTWGGPGRGVLSGDISNGGALTLGVTVNSGILTLSGNNTFSGPLTTIDGVTTYVKGVDVGTAATLILGSNTAVGTGGFLRTTSTTSTIQVGSSAISLGSGNRFFVSNGTTITGTNSLTINGTTAGNGGGFTITNNNSGGLILNGSVLARDGTASGTGRTMVFGGDSLITINGVVGNGSSTGACLLNYVGTSTLKLTGSNTYTGTTRVGGTGKILLDFSAAGAPVSHIINNSALSSSLTLGGDGTATSGAFMGGNLQIRGNSGATNDQRFNGTTFATRTASTFRVDQNGATAVNVTLGGLTRNAGSTVDFTLPTTGAISSTTVTSIGTNKVNGSAVAYSTVGGATWLTNNAGALGALADGSYQVNLFAASGDTDVTASTAPTAFTNNTLRFNTASKTLTLNASGVSTVTSGGILVTANGTGSVIDSAGGSAALRPGAGNEIVIHNYADLAISAPFINNGTSALTFAGPGITTLSGTNTYTGVTSVTSGTALFAKQVSLYNNTPASWTAANIIVSSGATAAFRVGAASEEFTSADIDALKGIVGTASTGFTGGSFLGLDTSNAVGGNFTYSSAIANTFAGANALGLQKLGSNKLTLDNTSTYTGATIVKAGTLAVTGTGSINGTSGVTVKSGATFAYTSSTNMTKSVTLENGSTLGGENWNGSLAGLTIGNGKTISPGMSPGNANTPSQTWASGGILLFEIDDATGAVSTNWDHLTVASALTLDSSLLSTPFTIKLTSLDLPSGDASPGLLDNFDSGSTQTWTFANVGSFAGTAFSSSMFFVDPSDFDNPLAGGSFSVVQNSATTLAVQFNAVPEPTSALLVLAGLGACAFGRRRRE